MKREKCDFFKKHIQYLGHLIAEDGFTQLPEKLQSIRNMPKPKTPKEVKQFLGLIGYYRKLVPRFSDIAKSLTILQDMIQNLSGQRSVIKLSNI